MRAIVKTWPLLAALPLAAPAETMINPVGKAESGKFQGSAFLSTSTVDMEFGAGDADIDRTLLGVAGAVGLSANLDLFGGIAFATDVDYEGRGDGDGTQFGFGIRGRIPVQGDLRLHGYLQYTLYDEDVDSDTGSFDIEGDGHDLRGGVLVASVQEATVLFAGVEAILSEDLDVDPEVGGSVDADHDTSFGFRIGAELTSQSGLKLHGQAAFGHEQNFMISVATNF